MNFQYSKEDLESFQIYLKANPEGSIDGWLKDSKSKLTEEEKKWFAPLEMSEINIPIKDKLYKLYLVNWNGVGGGHYIKPMNRFIQKYFGDSWYQFDTDMCSDYAECMLVTKDKDFFEYNDWEDSNIKGEKKFSFNIDGCEILGFNTFKFGELDTDEISENCNIVDGRNNNLSRQHCRFRIADYDVFMKDMHNLKFKPVLPLFDNGKCLIMANKNSIKQFQKPNDGGIVFRLKDCVPFKNGITVKHIKDFEDDFKGKPVNFTINKFFSDLIHVKCNGKKFEINDLYYD